jgi:hypothetical protein
LDPQEGVTCAPKLPNASSSPHQSRGAYNKTAGVLQFLRSAIQLQPFAGWPDGYRQRQLDMTLQRLEESGRRFAAIGAALSQLVCNLIRHISGPTFGRVERDNSNGIAELSL